MAHELGTRAAEVGFEWKKVGDLLEKIEEEIHELRQELAAQPPSPSARVEEEVGDLLFAVANLSRFLHFDPESCLRRANQKFQRRFQAMEQEILKSGKQLEGMFTRGDGGDLDEHQKPGSPVGYSLAAVRKNRGTGRVHPDSERDLGLC